MSCQNKKSLSGMVLILAILVIGSVLGAVVLFTNLIIREIQQTRLIDQSIQALYLAESGAERALYQIRRREAVIASDCAVIILGSSCQETPAQYGTCSGSDGELACVTSDEGTLLLGNSWQVSVTHEPETTVPLGVGESFQLDLFNPYLGGEFQTNVEAFIVQGSDGLDRTLFGEIVNLTWLVGGSLDCPNNFVPPKPATTRGFISMPGGTTSYLTGFTGEEPLNPRCSYVLRLSNTVLPLAQSGEFIISLHSESSGDPEANRVAIPSRLIINTQATFGRSLQRVQVRTPIRPPLSGLYDFVLFSEEVIIK